MKTYAKVSILCLSLLAVPAQASGPVTLKKVAGYGLTGAFLASILKYNFTKPNNNPVRYDLKQLLAGQNVSDNVKYAIIDGLIGHGEEKAKVFVDTKDNCIKVDETVKAKPKGIYGHIDAYWLKPILRTLAFAAAFRATKSLINNGIYNWSNFSVVDELIL